MDKDVCITGDLTTSVMDVARSYLMRGWSVIPVPQGSKAPVLKQWQKLRISIDQITQYFTETDNVGVLLGEPSGQLVDIDLDHPRAVELAAEYLPATNAVFGRPGKPRSHWIYRTTAPIKTKKFQTAARQMLVELRSTGTQTVFPPSIHVSGEPIRWEQNDPTPIEIDPQDLLASVGHLADAVHSELGELQDPPPEKSVTRRRRGVQPSSGRSGSPGADPSPPIFAGGRNDALTSLAGRLRYFGAELAEIESRLLAENQLRCAPPLKDEEVCGIAQSIVRYPVGAACLHVPDQDQESGQLALGQRDPDSCRIVLSPKRTLPTAEAFVRAFYLHDDGPTVIHFAGSFWAWSRNRYEKIEDGAVAFQLQPWLHRAAKYAYDRNTRGLELKDFDANPKTVSAALETLRGYTYLAASSPHPSWLNARMDAPPAEEILACRTKLFHLPTQTFLSPTPNFFTFNALDFDPEVNAPLPQRWLAFLGQLFGQDDESIDLLQEWCGYCLICDTSQQKMLLIVGPKRSGKGTIARVLKHLVGVGNVCGPTTSSLAGSFGLQPLIGQSLAVVSDARFHGESTPTVLERLLCISGEDTLTIDRKHQTSVTLKLPTRFLFLSNELPRLSDASGALASRFLILRLRESFYGREDHFLTERLLAELPGILNWAIQGWNRLRDRGHFVMPLSVSEDAQRFEELGSPAKEFVRECCVVTPGSTVTVSELFAAWTSWCTRVGRHKAGSRQSFGKDLDAAIVGLRCRKGTGGVRFYEGIGLRADPL